MKITGNTVTTHLAWKLFRKRKDGSLGSLFMNRRAKLPIGKWMEAKPYRTKGFAFRPGWHSVAQPRAPHLSEKGRVWKLVQLRYSKSETRPEAQGGTWYVSKWLKIIDIPTIWTKP